MKKLALSIITCNRSKHIREDLAFIAQPTREQNIDIYIFDGSLNDCTQYVVNQYIMKGNDHIHYFHMSKAVSVSENFCERLDNAIHVPEARYVWLSGDKFVIRPENYQKIFSYIEESYDIITVYGQGVLKGSRRFNEVGGFVDYAIVPITHLGSTIIKKELIEPYNLQREMRKQPAFGPQLIYLRAIADSDSFKGAVIDAGSRDRIVSRYKTESSTVGSMWSAWVLWWYRFIEELPAVYDTVRENLYNKPDLQLGFFSLKELLRQRSEDQFECKKYWECREYAKKVIVMPAVFVFCISLFPRNFAKWLCLNCDYGKRVCDWIKDGVRLIGEKL